MSFMDEFEHLRIPLKYIKAATNDFSDKPIGNGGFGDVYKGELLLPNGAIMVAFKRLNRQFGQGDVEFWKEITMLSELKHKNVASLLHFCNEDNERILVYKYASRGSLDMHLGDASLTWPQRLDICLGAARGIAYLHDPKNTQQRVLHRDIKSSNILLVHKWTAKVSDFGLSKIGPANQARTYLVSNMVGTPGYCDPGYWETGFLSKECDVYSFGVVLFEVMCGRLCYILHDKGKVTILVYNWRNCFIENRLDDIIFPELKEQINHESLSTFAAIANRCLDRDYRKRPHMIEIVKELEAAIHQQNSSQHIPYVSNRMPVSYNPMKEFQHLKIHLEDIKSATNNFNDTKVIGMGGFGNVYKGELLSFGEPRVVSVKRLDRRFGQGDTELWKDITVLSKNKHENLVSLLGFCDDNREKILIHEYASHGSLDRHLSSTDLTWHQRLKICLGAARGLNYLHDPKNTQQQQVIHRDIKSANILLDDNWSAKISDFGLSKFVLSDEPQTDHVGNLVGTIGYYDPSYVETGIFSKKSDVYSFGVVLLEVLCGRPCFGHHNGQFNMLTPKWKKYYEEKRLNEIIFNDLTEQITRQSLDIFSSVAYHCVNEARDKRPSLSEIVKGLELALEQQEHFEEMQRISSISKNELLMCFPKGILVEDGKTWLSKHENGGVCEIVSAIECISADSFLRDNIENSRFSNVLRGLMHNGFKVEVKTHFLSPKMAYTVNLVFKHSGTDHGTHIPFKFKLDEDIRYSNSHITRVKEDGWLRIVLHQFTSSKKAHDFKIEFVPLFELTSLSIEYFLEGIEFRPVEYVS